MQNKNFPSLAQSLLNEINKKRRSYDRLFCFYREVYFRFKAFLTSVIAEVLPAVALRVA